MVEAILKNPFYCGTALSKVHGPYPHKYPRLISRELFDKCQDVRLSRQKSPAKAVGSDFLFGNGLLHCAHCGCTMSPELKKGRLVYYSCTNSKGICKREYIREERLLEPVYEILDKFGTISEQVQNELVEELRKNTEAEKVFHKAQIKRIRKDYDRVQALQNSLLEKYIDPDNQSITKDIYDKKHEEYNDQLQKLNIELEEYTEADYDYQTTVATVISVARRARAIFDGCSENAEKRIFLNYLFQNPSVQEKKLCFSIASPFNLVLELADCPDLLRGRDSNLRPAGYTYPIVS